MQFGPNMTSGAPGSMQNLYLIVSDIEAARKALIARSGTPPAVKIILGGGTNARDLQNLAALIGERDEMTES